MSKTLEKVKNKQGNLFLKIYFQNSSSVLENILRTQHCLLLTLENWKEAVGKDERFGRVLTVHIFLRNPKQATSSYV